MITSAEMFGAFNRLALAMVVQEFQAAFSGNDLPAVVDQTAPQSVAPAQAEIEPSVASSPEPGLAAFLPTFSAPAGQTLLGLTPPLAPSAPVSLSPVYFSQVSAPALLATRVVMDDAGWNGIGQNNAGQSNVGQSNVGQSNAGLTAGPAPSAPDSAAAASSNGIGVAANPDTVDFDTADSNAPGQSATPQSPAPADAAATPASAASAIEMLSTMGASVAFGLTSIAPPGAAQDGISTQEEGAAGDESLLSSSAKIQISKPGLEAPPVVRDQSPVRAVTSPANSATVADSHADVADIAAGIKDAPALDGALTNHASGEASLAPLSTPAPTQRPDALPSDNRAAAFVARLDPSSGVASLQMESAGVIDSYILNAAMIPGWPLQRPFEPLGPEALGAHQPALQAMDDEELVDYLAGMGANEALSERIRKASDDPVRRRKLLRTLVIFIAIVTTIVDAMRAEIEALVAELRAGQSPGVALAPHSRRRMLLE
jgi:hypothetical protein